MFGFLGNSWNVWVFGEFPKCLGILEISSHLRNFQNLKNIPPSNICRYLGNFPDTQAFGKFPRYPGIWEIPNFDIYDNCCHSLKLIQSTFCSALVAWVKWSILIELVGEWLDYHLQLSRTEVVFYILIMVCIFFPGTHCTLIPFLKFNTLEFLFI